MRLQASILGAGLTLTAAFLATGPTSAGGKDKAFKQAVPGDAVKELIAREAKIIEEIAGGKLEEEGVNRIKLGGALIAALTLSSKDGDSADARAAGIKIATLAAKKGADGEIKKLAGGLGSVTFAKGAGDADLSKLGLDKAALMDHFKTKMKGGDGIHADLQSNIRLKEALNGVEEKIRALAMKKMLQPGLDKEAKELALLGYRAAVVAELTNLYTPARKAKQDPAVWRDSAVATRDAGFDLAAAAEKKDVDAVFKASTALNSACSRCHIEFRN